MKNFLKRLKILGYVSLIIFLCIIVVLQALTQVWIIYWLFTGRFLSNPLFNWLNILDNKLKKI